MSQSRFETWHLDLRDLLGLAVPPVAIPTTDGQEVAVPHPESRLIGKHSLADLDKQGFINNLEPLHIVFARELSRRNGAS